MLVPSVAYRCFLLGVLLAEPVGSLADGCVDDPAGGATLDGAAGLGGVPRVLVYPCSR